MSGVLRLPPPFSMSLVLERAGVQVARLAGDLDLGAEPAFVEAFKGVPVTDLVVDVTHLTFLDSCGVRLLIDLRRRYSAGGLALCCPPTGPIRRVVDLTAIPELIPTHHTVAIAVAALFGGLRVC